MSVDASSLRERRRLVEVRLDEASLAAGNPDQEHERRVAIFDLIDENSFALPGHDGGPYRLALALQDGKLMFGVSTAAGETVATHLLALKPLRAIVRDYLLICDSHRTALRNGVTAHVEAIDMGRRGLHDEGATMLGERLASKIVCDHATLRRLFTLITALHWKG